MTDIENLQRKIRHYCLDNFDFWMKKYNTARSGRPETFEYTYEKEDYNLFPRYNALEALLQGVEEVNVKSLHSLEEGKKLIINTAIRTETIFTEGNHGTEKNAIKDERRKFEKFVNSISIEDLKNVPELFYRRKLTVNESKNWKDELYKEEGIKFEGYWYPIESIKENIEEYLIFDEDEISEKEESKLNQLIIEEIENKYLIINEDNTNYELEKETFDIFNLSPEAYLINEDLNWLIYYSHEDFYIIKSKSIKKKIIQEFPQLTEHMNKMIKNVS
jgi:hypothetical protein